MRILNWPCKVTVTGHQMISCEISCSPTRSSDLHTERPRPFGNADDKGSKIHEKTFLKLVCSADLRYWERFSDSRDLKIVFNNSKFVRTGFVVGGIGGFGVTGGAHRFWCHRAFKAKLPLRIILMLCYCTAGQVGKSSRLIAEQRSISTRCRKGFTLECLDFYV